MRTRRESRTLVLTNPSNTPKTNRIHPVFFRSTATDNRIAGRKPRIRRESRTPVHFNTSEHQKPIELQGETNQPRISDRSPHQTVRITGEAEPPTFRRRPSSSPSPIKARNLQTITTETDKAQRKSLALSSQSRQLSSSSKWEVEICVRRGKLPADFGGDFTAGDRPWLVRGRKPRNGNE